MALMTTAPATVDADRAAFTCGPDGAPVPETTAIGGLAVAPASPAGSEDPLTPAGWSSFVSAVMGGTLGA
ncbi:hypothetical protein [Streptomyces lonarensis]|uniref:DUF397 domain-containing protein n=1 Tax=Streptomyces lonarensis TaxID=700599 RepID=A0A7X6D2L0_9ACTN|nr:hypothetical protein [Streptomyces lonarensis]NJQ07044.1 hypothetical protein [Streptomyces lonarensis]